MIFQRASYAPLAALVSAALFATSASSIGCGAPTPAAALPSASPGASTALSVPTSPAITPEIRASVDAADRDPADRALDAGRKPADLLAFMGVKPGMRVAELGAGGGYTTELLARVVGPNGIVFGQNNNWILERFAKKPWEERLLKPANKNVIAVTREFDDPLPSDAKDLDAVVCVLFYHDTFWLKVDRNKMNAAVFRALKPGGVYVIVDHSGRPGTGATEVESLHRIDEVVVRQEMEKVGFKLLAESNAWRDATDTRDWNASPLAAGVKRGHSDRFALKFSKP